MVERAANLVPLKPFLIVGHGLFLAVVIFIPMALFAPFWSFKFGAEWRSAIPVWASFHWQEWVLVSIGAAAYPICGGGGLLAWAFQGRNARRYLRQRRGLLDAKPAGRNP